METLAFILHNLPAIGERTLEHLSIVSVAVGIASAGPRSSVMRSTPGTSSIVKHRRPASSNKS